MFVLRALLLLALLLPAHAAIVDHKDATDTLVVVVRHAEKASDDPRDPILSEAGIARAQALAAALAELHLETVLVTQYKRTQLTAAPAAQAAGVQPEIIEASSEVAESANALAQRIRGTHRGQVVLVVGHSNTVGAIVEALSGAHGFTPSPIADDEYDRLYLLQIPQHGPVRVLQSRY
jgi:phosphohistidine phosphatase SixA